MDRCLKELQPIFGKVIDQLVLWEAKQNNGRKYLQSLSNLADQLHAARACDSKQLWQKSSLGQFQDLIIRLNYKQVQAMEVLIKSLKVDLMTYYDITNSIARLKLSASNVYKKHAEGISLQAAVTKTSTCPALVDLLDWLEEIERFYYNWYITKKQSLHNLNYEDIGTVNTMEKLWNENVCTRYLKDAREQIGVFLANTL